VTAALARDRRALVNFAQTHLARRVQNPPMPGSEFRTKAAECGFRAQDASRADVQRAESKFQETLWLKMANEAEETAMPAALR
jgi:hypothetical protein